MDKGVHWANSYLVLRTMLVWALKYVGLWQYQFFKFVDLVKTWN